MIKMSDLIKKQGDMIRKESGMNMKEDRVGKSDVHESWKSGPGYSSKEAKDIMDASLKDYAGKLRKLQHQVIKDWMSKAKSGVIDFFDINRGLQTGDASRAHPYETEFLHSVLTKDKIIDRFRKYFGGKKGKKR